MTHAERTAALDQETAALESNRHLDRSDPEYRRAWIEAVKLQNKITEASMAGSNQR